MKFFYSSVLGKAAFFFTPVFQGILFTLIAPHALANPTSSLNSAKDLIVSDRVCDVPILKQLPSENVDTEDLVKQPDTCVTQETIETENTSISQESIPATEDIISQDSNQSSEMAPEVSPDKNENLTPETETIDAEEGDRWHFKFQPYGTIPISTYGNTTIRGRTIDYHLDLGSLLDILQFAGSGRMEAWNGNLGFIIDAYYISLKGTGIKSANRFPNASVESTLSFNQGIYDFALSYHFGDAAPYNLPKEPSNKPFPLLWFEPIAGIRLNAINAAIEDVNFNLGSNSFSPSLQRIETDQGRTWIEPMLGGKLGLQISDPITFWIRGDASGFGMAGDTNLSWNLLAGMDWWVNRTTSLQLGYRFYEINYKNGTENNAFGFEQSFNGPFIAATFHF
jgi:hypothetical protein